MPGKRIPDPSLTRTNFTEAVTNGAELLADWDGLTWARPISVSLLGNAWFKGSSDGVTWSDSVLDTDDYLKVSTDGGVKWRVIDLTGISVTTHDPVTVGVPDGGLSVTAGQVLTLSPASDINPGSMSSSDYTKLSDLKFDYLDNIGGGVEIYKDYATVGQDRTFNLKTLVAGAGVTLTAAANTITIDATGAGGGEVNTASNVTTDGVGVFDGKSGVDLQFRGIASLYAPLTVTLDDTDNDIDLNLDETLVDHDNLLNFVADEHVDHTSVEIATEEGIAGGGDLTATRTLTLSFDTLSQIVTTPDTSDLFAFYRATGDLHYSVSYQDLLDGVTEVHNTIYVPLTTGVYSLTGLTGGGVLDADRYIGLAFNDLPTVAYDSVDYVPIYDVSNANHAKVTLASIIGELAVSITAGNGMNFSEITSTGAITLGTPSTLTESTTNQATGTTHTHVVDLSTWELDDLGDVPAPTPLYYLRRNAGNTAYEWVDPAIGASTPGAPANSIQFNNAGAFGGNSGLLYDPTTDTINFDDVNASNGLTFIFGDDTATSPYIQTGMSGLTSYIRLENDNAVQHYIQLLGSRVLLGDPTLTGDTFLHIKDGNNTSYDNVLKIDDFSDDELFRIDSAGDIYAPLLSSATEDNVLYYDTATGLITYGAKPTSSGGITTVTTDSLSGLMVNGGNTSSAATIELDQNDNKLTLATPETSDYIGFYDVSTGLQSKTTMAFLPGWNMLLDSVLQEEIGPGDNFNFETGTGITLTYTSATNTLKIDSSAALSNSLDWIEFEYGDFTAGTDRAYTLDLKALVDYTIISIVLETDTGTFTDVDLKINGVDVTGCAAMTATTTPSYTEYTATALNDVVEGDRVTLTLGTAYTGSPTFLAGKLNIQRV